MARFLIDEDLPRSLARQMRASRFEAEDVRDVGLRGRTDDEIFEYARSRGVHLVTSDLGFGNPLRFPPDSSCGIVVVRFPTDLPPAVLITAVLNALREIDESSLRGGVILIEPGRIRLRHRT